MAGGIILAAIAAAAAAIWAVQAYNAYRMRRLARMEEAFKMFADMSQLLLRGEHLAPSEVLMFDFMLGLFRDERQGWQTAIALRSVKATEDPQIAAKVRSMPTEVLDAFSMAIEGYYLYMIEKQPIAGLFVERYRKMITKSMPEEHKQSEARAISAFQAALDHRHLNAA